MKDLVRNGVLHNANEERNTLHTINGRKANWINHIWRKICLLKHVINGEDRGKDKRRRRRGSGREQPKYYFENRRGYCELKEEALGRTLSRPCFGRDYGSLLRRTTERMQ